MSPETHTEIACLKLPPSTSNEAAPIHEEEQDSREAIPIGIQTPQFEKVLTELWNLKLVDGRSLLLVAGDTQINVTDREESEAGTPAASWKSNTNTDTVLDAEDVPTQPSTPTLAARELIGDSWTAGENTLVYGANTDAMLDVEDIPTQPSIPTMAARELIGDNWPAGEDILVYGAKRWLRSLEPASKLGGITRERAVVIEREQPELMRPELGRRHRNKRRRLIY
ncbi:hypothetical protein DFH09DRAFT_1081140 [Mycena vulgaris]|nr:hypothetical protein DFH09DRAFT_1081140 [Mycena vulgaris]